MPTADPISDEDLVAYLDDALDPAHRRRIDAALEADPGLPDRIAALDIDLPAIRSAMEGLAAAAPVAAPSLRLDPPAAPSRPTPRRGIAAWTPPWLRVAAALLLGVGLGHGLDGLRSDPARGPIPGDWRAAVANYQALYSKATLAPLDGDAPVRRAEVAMVSEQLGLPVSIEALHVPGLTFKRAQLLAFNGRPLAQFAYVDAAGTPVALCVIRGEGANSAARLESVADLKAVSWNKGGYGFVVIGDTGTAVLERAADVLSRTL